MNYSIYSKSFSLAALVTLVLGCNGATGQQQDDEKRASVPSSKVENVSSVEAKSDIKKKITETIHQKLGPIPIDKIATSPMPGYYEVIAQGQIIYISEKLDFLFPGPLLSLSSGELVNLTQNSLRRLDMEKAPMRAELIEGVKEQDMVVFQSPKEEYVVNVFTDVDCAYCRRLHQNMDGYLENGITIRYLAFPRAGVGSGAYNKLVSVWCSSDRQSAMDDAKLHSKFDPKDCDNPVADQYTMTRQLGLTGTPALILSDGELISGFLEPEKLLKHLKQKNG